MHKKSSLLIFLIPVQTFGLGGKKWFTSYELAMLLKKLMPMRTASPIPMIASPAGSAVEIMVSTSVFTVPTAVVKAPVNASVIVVYLL